jgi:hypothetical protein
MHLALRHHGFHDRDKYCKQDNLQKEQRAIMELFLKVVYQTLSPIQAALFVVESFPYHCDVLALANVLSFVVWNDSTAEGSGGNERTALLGLNSQLGGMSNLWNSQFQKQRMNNSTNATLNLSGGEIACKKMDCCGSM